MLAAVLCISDPLREEAKDVLAALRNLGVRNAVMLTGDSPRTAAAIAGQLGVDDFKAGVLPADKADYVAALRRAGHTVLMVGDGINDSPALSEADAGIAISDGAAIAREIADITIAADSLWGAGAPAAAGYGTHGPHSGKLPLVIGFNGALIGLGAGGRAASGHIRYAAQPVHSGGESAQHERAAPAQNRITFPDRARRSCVGLCAFSS